MDKSIFLTVVLVSVVSAQTHPGWKFLEKLYNECANDKDVLKCIKIQVLKLTGKALKMDKINVIEGVALVRDTKQARYSRQLLIPTNFDLQNLEAQQIDQLLRSVRDEFFSTHHLEIRQPRSTLVGEARKKDKKVNFGPLIAAMAIKSGFMAVAYKGIAVTAGAAMLIGKMALILCAIMGLKKLVSSKEEKLNVEVVKHPVHSSSHTYSSSYDDDHYQRSIDSAEEMLRRGEEMYGSREKR